jgi:biotin transport system substrate-specific component
VNTAPAHLPLGLALVPPGALWRVGLVFTGSALIAAAAQIAIPLPFSPVPVTGQTLAVLLVGAALGARLGLASVALYVVEGVIGLPVFAGGASGPARLIGPTGGYLIGFMAASTAVGYLAERGWDRRVASSTLAMLIGVVIIYAFGLAWLARFPLSVGLLEAGLLPFVAGDAYKVTLAVAALRTVRRITKG